MALATILCVDDSPQSLNDLESTLRRANYAPITASNNVEAYARLNDSSTSIDAAVIDLRLVDTDLKNRDGVWLAGALKNKIPVVILSAYIDDTESLEHAGVAGWVAKAPGWEPQLLELLVRLTKPAVYVSHEGSPRAREVSDVVKSLGLRVLPDLAEGDGDWDVIGKPALLQRFAFAVVLLPAERTGAVRERAIRKWGYLQGACKNEYVLTLWEDQQNGGGNPEHDHLGFDAEGAWKNILEQRLRAVGLVKDAVAPETSEKPSE